MEIVGKTNEGYVEELFDDAIHWLGVVGEYDHRIPKPDNDYNRSVDKALNFLAGQIAEGSIDVAFLLATMEREAQLHEGKIPDDDDFDRVVRTNQMYSLTRMMNAFSAPENTANVSV